MKQVRAFLAVMIDGGLAENIAVRQRSLEHRIQGMRWVDPGQYHLTIKFLGNVAEEKVEPVKEALHGAFEDLTPFQVSLKGIGAFPYESSPRVIWIGVDAGADELVRLWRRVEQSVDRLGFPPDKREFSPHLTLARAKAHSSKSNPMPIFERLREHQWGSTDVHELTLMKSELGRRGPTYSALARFSLAVTAERAAEGSA